MPNFDKEDGNGLLPCCPVKDYNEHTVEDRLQYPAWEEDGNTKDNTKPRKYLIAKEVYKKNNLPFRNTGMDLSQHGGYLRSG